MGSERRVETSILPSAGIHFIIKSLCWNCNILLWSFILISSVLCMNPDLILNNVMIGQLLFVSNLLNSMFVKYTTITGNFTAMFERSLLFFFFCTKHYQLFMLQHSQYLKNNKYHATVVLQPCSRVSLHCTSTSALQPCSRVSLHCTSTSASAPTSTTYYCLLPHNPQLTSSNAFLTTHN